MGIGRALLGKRGSKRRQALGMLVTGQQSPGEAAAELIDLEGLADDLVDRLREELRQRIGELNPGAIIRDEVVELRLSVKDLEEAVAELTRVAKESGEVIARKLGEG